MDALTGQPAGVEVGSVYRDRRDLRDAGLHRPLQAGIDGNSDGGYSIILSGGYVDDLDEGDRIVYTGQGGNDPQTKRQVADQTWKRGNLGLRVSFERGMPVRVIRGHKADGPLAPQSGYRYDGLFRITRAWQEQGVDGFIICRFELERLDPEANDSAGQSANVTPVQDTGVHPVAKELPDVRRRLAQPGEDQLWCQAVFSSRSFEKRRAAIPGAIDRHLAETLFEWLDANGGELAVKDLSALLETPPPRLVRFVAALSRHVNVDGYAVLEVHSERVRLDAALARRQFTDD